MTRDTKHPVVAILREHGPNPWVEDTVLYAWAELARALRDLRRATLRGLRLDRYSWAKR